MDFRSLSWTSLSKQEREQIKPFLANCPYILQESKVSKILLITAVEQKAIAGVILCFYYPVIQAAMIAHLFVKPEARQKKIATRLIEVALDELKKKGITRLELRYATPTPDQGSIEALLKKFSFSKSIPLLKRYFFDPHRFNPVWLHSPPPLSKDEELLLWDARTPKDEEQAKIWVRENPLADLNSPFDPHFPYEPKTSFALKKNSELIGWVITQKLDEAKLRYSGLFVDSSVRGSGAGVALLAAAIREHVQLYPFLIGIAEVHETQTPLSWRKFVNRWLAPFSIENNIINYSYRLDF